MNRFIIRINSVEFAVSRNMEYFLACRQSAFFALGVAPGAAPVYNPRYLDFARHYGFSISDCGVAKVLISRLT